MKAVVIPREWLKPLNEEYEYIVYSFNGRGEVTGAIGHHTRKEAGRIATKMRKLK
jgi:hypothetical protein